MTPPDKLAQLVEDLNSFDRQERIEALISLSNRFVQPSETVACKPYNESHRVPGCESEAFVFTEATPGGKARYHFAVLNPQGISAMAMAVILKDALDNEDATLAGRVPDEVVYDIFGRELSMGKSGGLMNMIRLLKAQAARLQKENIQ